MHQALFMPAEIKGDNVTWHAGRVRIDGQDSESDNQLSKNDATV